MDTDKRSSPIRFNQSDHKQTLRWPIALPVIFIMLSIMTVFSQGPGEVPTSSNRNRKPADRSTTKKHPRRPIPRQAPQIEMVLIPSGTFMMGSPEGVISSEHPQHRVMVQSFYMGKYEVTQAQYKAVMGANPSVFKGDNLPVENVPWNDAVEFCGRLSQMTGLKYRLPSEAEWEYACRAGTTGVYAGDLDSMAWYEKNSGGKTHPVGQKDANAWGLYDMQGNVSEWCEDWYHVNYNGAPTDGSAWESGGEQKERVFRGGAWSAAVPLLRSAYRFRDRPGHRPYDLGGFRVAAVRSS